MNGVLILGFQPWLISRCCERLTGSQLLQALFSAETLQFFCYSDLSPHWHSPKAISTWKDPPPDSVSSIWGHWWDSCFLLFAENSAKHSGLYRSLYLKQTNRMTISHLLGNIFNQIIHVLHHGPGVGFSENRRNIEYLLKAMQCLLWIRKIPTTNVISCSRATGPWRGRKSVSSDLFTKNTTQHVMDFLYI